MNQPSSHKIAPKNVTHKHARYSSMYLFPPNQIDQNMINRIFKRVLRAVSLLIVSALLLTNCSKDDDANNGVDVENGKTLYQIASETFNLTDAQKETFLDQAKTKFNYNTTISEEADRLLSL